MRYSVLAIVVLASSSQALPQATLDIIAHQGAWSVAGLDPNGSSIVFGSSGRGYRWVRSQGVTPITPPPAANGTPVFISGTGPAGATFAGSVRGTAVTWREGGAMIPLPHSVSDPNASAAARHCSADGSVVVGVVSDSNYYFPSSASVIWVDGLVHQNWGTVATDLSADARTVVGYERSNQSGSGGPTYYRPTAWRVSDPTHRVDLPLGLFDGGRAYGVNADGSVIVGAGLEWDHYYYAPPDAVVWRNGAPYYLSSSQFSESTAYAVDASGDTIVGSGYLYNSTDEIAWISLNGGAATPIGGVLAAAGAPVPAGVLLERATHVSQDGLTVAGHGNDASGDRILWVASFHEVGSKFCSPVGVHSGGLPASVSAIGSASITANDLVLQGRLLPAGTWGIFLMSEALTAATTQPGIGGSLCLSGPVAAFDRPGEIRSADAFGAIDLALNWTSLPGHGVATSGESYAFQIWYRDTAGATSSQYSDALLVTPTQ